MLWSFGTRVWIPTPSRTVVCLLADCDRILRFQPWHDVEYRGIYAAGAEFQASSMRMGAGFAIELGEEDIFILCLCPCEKDR